MNNKKFTFPKISFPKRALPKISADKKREIFFSALVICVALVLSALILGGLANLLKPIVERREEAFLREAMETLLPADEYESIDNDFDRALQILSAHKAVKNGEGLGYCIETFAQGYQDEIRILVGLDLQGSVQGVEILSVNETSGYGERIEEKEFLSQFHGKNKELTVVRGDADSDTKISAVSGATVSSNAVKEGVNHALAAVSQLRAEEQAKKAAEEAERIAAEEAKKAAEVAETEAAKEATE